MMAKIFAVLLGCVVPLARATAYRDLHPQNYVKHTAGKMAIIRFLGEKEKNDKLDASWKLLSKELRNNTQVLVGTVNCGAVGKPICEYMGIESTTVAWGDPWNLQPYDGGASYDELYGLVRRRMTFCAVDETQKDWLAAFLIDKDYAPHKLEKREKEMLDDEKELQRVYSTRSIPFAPGSSS
ncbi:hypothetical protein JL721_3628 [Aureococcus anophagefferens]|nr:hypothetical protein JL721_3628 [Aureococcus anophagefferens]